MPRDLWGSDEWRAYACFLEERGEELANELRRKEAQPQKRSAESPFTRAFRKHIKEKKGLVSLGTELLCFTPAKRGRKPNKDTDKAASLAFKISIELGKSHKDALADYYESIGMRRSRVRSSKTILNKMSKMHKSLKPLCDKA